MRSVLDRLRTPVLLVASIGILALVFGRGTEPLGSGTRAPEIDVETSEGPVRLGDGVTVVNFWRTDCPPCRAEAPVLARAHARLARDGGRVLGLCADGGGLDAAADSARRLGMRYPIAVADPVVLSAYRVDLLPTTYVVAESGRITASFVGAVSERDLEGALRDAR